MVGGKFIPEMHLSQSKFTYTICRLFTKDKEQIQKLKETKDSTYNDQNELDKVTIMEIILWDFLTFH